MEITAILTENITPNVPPDVSYEISPQDQALFITTVCFPLSHASFGIINIRQEH
uniref:Uncharacterized protein n=1 Tax=Rhizophagus irregularis (strain DAOM 181602 / DAOM 197198 / MUCL 43194) TaxID=747089 RepID=U9TGF5_RHIID